MRLTCMKWSAPVAGADGGRRAMHRINRLRARRLPPTGAERELRDGGNAHNTGDTRGKTQSRRWRNGKKISRTHRAGREERPTDGR